MQSLKVILIILGLAISVSGCATPISAEKIATADYGKPPPPDYEKIIKSYINRQLIDPTSSLFEFDAPGKGYTRNAPVFGTVEMFGWRVCGTVNAKNRFGGYTGRVPFFILFQGNEIVAGMIGETTDSEDYINFVNSSITKACNR